MSNTLNLPKPNQLTNQTVIMRVDYNVPLKEVNGQQVVGSDKRIQSSLKTLRFLLDNQAKVLLISHLGRPKTAEDKQFSLEPVAKYLEEQLQLPVKFVPDCIGDQVKTEVAQLQPGQALLLENLRFYPEEKKNDPGFAQQLASLANLYVNEAFSNCHRAHASMVALPKLLPHFAGFSLINEVKNLRSIIIEPKRPLVIVVGGAKIADKVEAVQNLSNVADMVLVGGGVANNFLKAAGIEVHKSYLQDVSSDLNKEDVNYVELASKLINQNRTQHILKDGYIPLPKILYPTDVIAAPTAVMQPEVAATSTPAATQIIDLYQNYPDTDNDQDLMYLDIGPKTVRLYSEIILQAGTIFWNGPMGVFEQAAFAQGTREIARAIAKSGAMTILGGGDTIAAINQFNLADRYDYVSAAGGASLDLLAGKKLPGLEALEE